MQVVEVLAEAPGQYTGHRQFDHRALQLAAFGKWGEDHAIGRPRAEASTKINAMTNLELIVARGGGDVSPTQHIPLQRDRKAQRSVAPMIYRQRNFSALFMNKMKCL